MTDRFLDRLEAELGPAVRARILAAVGGQRRHVPMPVNVPGSRLAAEIGLDAAQWLAQEFGGEQLDFPSRGGAAAEDRSARLAAAVLEAGLTQPCRSANDIAAEFGVTAVRVRQVRRELREARPAPVLPLFPGL